MGRAIQQNAQMMNMLAQQRAAERQAAKTSQEMQFAAAEEARKAELQGPTMDKARAEATAAGLKTALDFSNFVYTGLSNAADPAQAVQIAQRIGQQPQFQEDLFQGALADAMSTMPQDPAQFEVWKENTLSKTLDGAKRLERQLIEQNLGATTRVISAPKYGSGGAARVLEGSEAPVTVKPIGMNVEGVGPGVLDPESDIFYPATMGTPGGYKPPRGPMSVPRGAPGAGGGSSPVKTALQTNPGALKDGPFARSQPGYAGASGGFATFKTPEEGIRAQENLLRTAYVGKGFNTIDKIVNRYAPLGPENSAASVANYKNYVAQRTGLDITAPITAAQVPAVAAAMREFETGQRPGGTPPGRGAAGAPAAEPKTIEQTKKEQAFKKLLPLLGYDPVTGVDTVSPLITKSTSGGLEMLGSDIVGFATGEATPGREALGQLEALAANMTFEKLQGKLGAQVSDADVKLVANTMADIARGETPANERLAKWQNVVLPILLRGAGIEPKKPAGGKRKPLSEFGGRR